MGLSDIFNKNKNYLKNRNEKKAAQILLDIIYGFKIDEPMISNPKVIEYVAVYKMIKESIENVCQNPLILSSTVSIEDAEETILLILKNTVESLKEI